jgi:hypothetical protein
MHGAPRRDFMFAAGAIDGWQKIGAVLTQHTAVAA